MYNGHALYDAAANPNDDVTYDDLPGGQEVIQQGAMCVTPQSLLQLLCSHGLACAGTVRIRMATLETATRRTMLPLGGQVQSRHRHCTAKIQPTTQLAHRWALDLSTVTLDWVSCKPMMLIKLLVQV